MEFCSPFDEALARGGPAGVFLRDRNGAWRFQADWTRDAWGRASGPHAHAWTWLLLRDRASGFVLEVLCTSPTLLPEHPRFDVRVAPSGEAAEAELAALGRPPLAEAAW